MNCYHSHSEVELLNPSLHHIDFKSKSLHLYYFYVVCDRCGKTTACQMYAERQGHKLLSVNCNMHTESSDFLGGLRPVRHYVDAVC